MNGDKLIKLIYLFQNNNYIQNIKMQKKNLQRKK